MTFLDDPILRKRIRKSLIWGANSKQDICETLRFVYDSVYKIEDKELKEQITQRLIDAMIMGKRMADRLWYYKLTYGDTTGKSGNDIGILPEVEKRKLERRSRPIEAF